MIASVRGTVLRAGLDSVVIDLGGEVGGVGMLVHTTPRTAAGMRVGQSAALATTLVVREESLTLFGFADEDERAVFETVQTVTGFGPRLALAMLAVHSPDAVRAAVTTGDLVALTKVPGIGRKGAERIVLELRDKIGVPTGPRPRRGRDRSGRPSSGSAGPPGRPTTPRRRSPRWRRKGPPCRPCYAPRSRSWADERHRIARWQRTAQRC